MIKAVIFDVGGVLLRTEDQSGRRKWENRLGLEQDGLGKLVFDSDSAGDCTIGKLSEREVWSRLAQRLSLSSEQAAELETDFWSGDRLDSDLVSALKSLRPRYRTAILSNAWTGARLSFTEKYRLHEAVDILIISAEEGLAKPDPAIYQLAASRLGCQPQECVFVDDFPVNIEAARSVGMQAVHFRGPQLALKELSQILGHPIG